MLYDDKNLVDLLNEHLDFFSFKEASDVSDELFFLLETGSKFIEAFAELLVFFLLLFIHFLTLVRLIFIFLLARGLVSLIIFFLVSFSLVLGLFLFVLFFLVLLLLLLG